MRKVDLNPQQLKILDTILSASPDHIYIYDRDRRYLYANQSAAEALGLSQSDIIGKHWRELNFPADVMEPFEARLKEVLAMGTTITDEISFPTVYGVRDFSYALRPARSEDGSIVAAVATIRDTTEQKRAAEEVRESRRQVLDILESITDGFFALDNLWRFTYVNYRAQRLLRRRKEELFFKNIWEVLPETASSIFYREYHRAKEEMVPVTFEAFYPPLNRWFEVHAYPYKNGLSVYLSDVTERIRAEEKLRENEERLRTIVDNTTAHIYIKDIEGRYLLINREQERLLNMTREQVLGKTDYDLFPKERADALRANGRKVIGTGVPMEFEEKIPLEDGVHTVISVKYPLRDAKGEIYGVYGISADITERKRAEEELHKACDELERRVEERTAELSKSNALLEQRIAESKKIEEERAQLANRMQLLMDSTDEGIYGIDMEGRGVLLNKAAANMTGYKQEEVLGKDVHELIHHSRSDGSPYPSEECPIIRVPRTGRGVRIDTEVFWRKDGTSFPVEYSSYPIIEEGAIKGAIVTFTDITERKKAAFMRQKET